MAQPRKENSVGTELITIRTTEQICRDLDALLATERFGKSRAEVAEQLLREKVRDLILEGWTGEGPQAIAPRRGRKR